MANNSEINTIELEWTPIKVRLGDLEPWPDNPREIVEDQAKRLLDGTEKFGQPETLAIGPKPDDGKHPIYNGHQRYFTWMRAWGPEFEVHALISNRPLTLDERQEITILLHKGATGRFAFDKLINWDHEKLMGWGFPKKELIAGGFEIDKDEAQEDDAPDPDEADELREKWNVEFGQLWTLGTHRLICGDATKLPDVLRLMDGETAALCATDPPYFIDYTGERAGGGKDYTDHFTDGELDEDLGPFYKSAFENVLQVLAPHAAIYCWHSHQRQPDIDRVWTELGILNHQQIIWKKPAPLFGSVFWHFQHEPCLMGWRQGSMPIHDGDHTYSTIWEISFDGKSRNQDHVHPTQKPVELFARPMRKHTEKGDVCFEPFVGSGSQVIAAEQMRRRCFAMDIEPAYVALTIERWVRETGGTPILLDE
jgi:DNA modification methylase